MVEVLDTIMAKWHDNPHLRLGQLLVVATGVNDIFYVEDYILVNKVRSLEREDKSCVSTKPKDEPGKASSTIDPRSLGSITDAVREFISREQRDSTRSKR